MARNRIRSTLIIIILIQIQVSESLWKNYVDFNRFDRRICPMGKFKHTHTHTHTLDLEQD